MPRKEFPPAVVESVLIKCRRHCCVCDHWCGQKIEIHHIGSSDDNSEDNAIAVCFDCHAEIGHYNPKHPRGRRFTKSELQTLRDSTFRKYTQSTPDVPKGASDYGRGFHDGVVWAEKVTTAKDAWRLLSVHGDFVLEILIHFERQDHDTMMNLVLFDDNVDTGMGVIQSDGHKYAWSSGQSSGFWDLDNDQEQIFLTTKGKVFREIVFGDDQLRRRYEQLKTFWQGSPFETEVRKPPVLRNSGYSPHDFEPGVMNALQTEIYGLARTNADKAKLYVIQNVTPARLVLLDIETGEEIDLKARDIADIVVDRESGEFVLDVKL